MTEAAGSDELSVAETEFAWDTALNRYREDCVDVRGLEIPAARSAGGVTPCGQTRRCSRCTSRSPGQRGSVRRSSWMSTTRLTTVCESHLTGRMTVSGDCASPDNALVVIESFLLQLVQEDDAGHSS